MRRKRRSPAPSFKQPAPSNPITGQFAELGQRVDLTRVAMMQVLEIKDDYLVCRGFDPEEKRFFNSVAVAKPYLLRKKRPQQFTVGGIDCTPAYFEGDILACAKPRTALGDTPGQPTEEGTDDLDYSTIEICRDENGSPIHWMDLNVGGRTSPSGVPFYNADSEEAPAYGLMQVCGAIRIDEIDYIQVKRFNSESPPNLYERNYVVNLSSPDDRRDRDERCGRMRESLQRDRRARIRPGMGHDCLAIAKPARQTRAAAITFLRTSSVDEARHRCNFLSHPATIGLYSKFTAQRRCCGVSERGSVQKQ